MEQVADGGSRLVRTSTIVDCVWCNGAGSRSEGRVTRTHHGRLLDLVRWLVFLSDQGGEERGVQHR